MKRNCVWWNCLAGVLACGAPAVAHGQTAQSLSVQVSALASAPFAGSLSGVTTGPGVEAQVRFNPSAFSIGAGVEASFHSVEGADPARDVSLTGGFLEPRVVLEVGSPNIAWYLAARFAVSRTSVDDGVVKTDATGFTANGGGGLLISLTDRTNLDLGSTVGFKDLGENNGASLGSGGNVVVRLGLAVGLGG